jgi:glycosyltransferase involved in cell wall biosynthesis
MKLKLLNSFLNKCGFELNRTLKPKDRLVKNVFNKNGTHRRVLISYITDPFTSGIKFSHSIYTECYTAAQVFDSLGYIVDVANYHDATLEINFSKYSIVYGQGYPLEKAFYAPNVEQLLKISYGTGTSLFYFFKVSGQVVYDFYHKHGLWLPESARMHFNFWPMQFTCPDALVVLSNQYCEQTYLDINPKLKSFHLNAFYFDEYDIDLNKKDFSKTKQHFLWFGSNGLLYKGLGIAIDIASKRKDIVLHICGARKEDVKFWQHYKQIVDKCDNIIDHGFVDIKTEDFKRLMDSCCFVLFPSTSEGGAVASINVMANGGLIPIISRGTCLDVEEFGYIFDEISEEQINLKIDKALMLSEEQLKAKSILTKKTVRKDYQLASYQQNLQNIITTIVKEHTIMIK